MQEHNVTWAYENEDGNVVRMQCVCGWNVTIHNDPRYDSDPIEARSSHYAAASVEHWEGMVTEAGTLPDGRVKTEARQRYRRELEWAQHERDAGWLTGRPSSVVPVSE
jgi:hypothetical protein